LDGYVPEGGLRHTLVKVPVLRVDALGWNVGVSCVVVSSALVSVVLNR
jgi:hypothetical protein